MITENAGSENPVQSPPDSGAARPQAVAAEIIAGTMPPLELPDAKPGIVAKAKTAFGQFKRKRGRPPKPDSQLARPRRANKNPFAAPENLNAPAIPGAEQDGATVPPVINGNPVEVMPSVPPVDLSEYGEALCGIECGLVQAYVESTIYSEGKNKAPREFLDRHVRGFELSGRMRDDIKVGWTGIARLVNNHVVALPAGGGEALRFLSGQTQIVMHVRAALREFTSELRKLPDLNKPGNVVDMPPTA